ncbi:MAG: fatty acid desaturase [Kofleriaceae bacterium]|nr:fatty acid desaturase [Kofleriaceae bacterium]
MLRYKADRRTIAFVGTYYALVALALSIELPWPASIALAVSMSFLSFFCAVITHNTVHTPVFKSRTLNRIFQVFLSLTYGHPVSMFVPGHNLSHHKYLQTPKDRMRTDKMRFGWNLLNQLFFNFAVGGAIFKDNAEYAKAMRTKRPVWYRQLMIELGAYAVFLLATLAISIWQDGSPWRFLVFIVIPHQYAVWGIAGINFVQHDGTEPGHAYNHSRNFTGKLVNWFTFNNGFHGIHHMHPGLHWSLAPGVHAKELAPFVDPRLEEPSLLAYCFRAYIWPGRRLRFDGTPVVLGPSVPDEPWIPGALVQGMGDADDDSEYGAVA